MKNLLWILLMVTIVNISASAQDDGAKLVKKAKKAITNYFLDPSNKDNLAESQQLIEKAFATGTVDNDAAAWATKGDIYAELAKADAAIKMIDPNVKLKNIEAPFIAFESYKMSIAKATKESAKKDANNGLNELIPMLSTSGLEYFYDQNFEKAFRDFKAIIEAYDIAKSAKLKTALDKPEDLNNQYYVTGLSALNAGKEAEAGEWYEKAFNGGNKGAEIYDGLFKSYQKSDPAKAEKYLTEGRTAYPDDNSLLFSEINLYLSQGKLSSLIDNLELACQKEPDNISVINTLGNVYDKLYQNASEKGDAQEAENYFNKAMESYNKALAKDPSNNFANYSMGTLYYNKAANYVKVMQTLSDDLSKEGMKKYDEAQKNMFGMFDAALPYFLKAEESDPKDRNTLIALREIYARKNQLDKAEEYKKKLDAL
ncbi:MAG TPA: hypothetical protein PLC76_06165 [Saprospiraceae bacterium]|nr:MAG: Tetratricopeptide TPR_2 repeat-containing protein [Candidatus Parvibacillus calidus]MBX2936537.1 hypothetical protein [Saprospiraceae bacterium]MBX7178631.1 hypothetical protein [Saprospiraceae bacterium]MCB0590340.1 hypothetical protein [Saprospiraceae bacterium]MCO5282969.1 hypothetical protein [Saprospiraceae bacterium]